MTIQESDYDTSYVKANTTYQYYVIHNWMGRHHGKPKFCENSACEGKSDYYVWALKKGFEYKRDRNHFFRLCMKCHHAYDDIPKKTSMLRKGKKLSKPSHRRVEVLASKLSHTLRFDSLTEASKQLNILRTSISNVLQNRSKTAGGYEWRYDE